MSLWYTRLETRREISENPKLVVAINKALGGSAVAHLHSVKLVGCRYDALLHTEHEDGRPAWTMLHTTIDDPLAPRAKALGKEQFDWRSQSLRPLGTPGIEATQQITFAPRLWFAKMGLTPQLTFEDVRPIASPEFRSALSEGIVRAAVQLDNFGEPRLGPPIWVRRRRRAGGVAFRRALRGPSCL